MADVTRRDREAAYLVLFGYLPSEAGDDGSRRGDLAHWLEHGDSPRLLIPSASSVADVLAEERYRNSSDRGVPEHDRLIARLTGSVAAKHPHYHKDVRHLKSADVYRVYRLFGVTDQAIGHAIKKLLVAGGRGVKDRARDVGEAIDTLRRWQEMETEDEAAEVARG